MNSANKSRGGRTRIEESSEALFRRMRKQVEKDGFAIDIAIDGPRRHRPTSRPDNKMIPNHRRSGRKE